VGTEKRTVRKSSQKPTISEVALADVTAVGTIYEHLRLTEYLCHTHDI
jgi:hypothetical protein